MKRSLLEFVNSVKCLRSKSVVAAVAVMAAAVAVVDVHTAAVAVVASLMVAVVAHATTVAHVKTVAHAMIVDLVTIAHAKTVLLVVTAISVTALLVTTVDLAMIAHAKTVLLVVTAISVTVALVKTAALAPIALVALAPILVMTHVHLAPTSVAAHEAIHAVVDVPTLVAVVPIHAVDAQAAHAVAHLQVATSAQRAVTD